ncbi:MAG: DUF1289 domain-containing protein [Pseudomonadales bacterium]|nr:DUF1289 domain-containing protein [Pseudomonadales bacterium]NRA16276.1 DUF1289 domain-containing protein [Oceanospirillaceae bacterium]
MIEYTNSHSAIKNPCIGVCALDDQDLCIACKRSGIEIAEWGLYTPPQKIAVLQSIQQRYADDERRFKGTHAL